MTVRQSLHRLEKVYHHLQSAALSDEPPDASEIIYLRRQFANAYLEFVDAIDADRTLALHLRSRDALKDTLDSIAATHRKKSLTNLW